MAPQTRKGKAALKLYTEHVARLAKQHESHPRTRLHARDCPTRSPSKPWETGRQTPSGKTTSSRLLGAEARSTGTDRNALQYSLSASLQSMLGQPDIHFPSRLYTEGIASVSPDGISVKPFNLNDVRGQGCTPARETKMWRTLEYIFGGWPPPSQRAGGVDLDNLANVDLAVGSSRRTIRAAGAAHAESSLVLDGITRVSHNPDMIQIERSFDFRAYRAASRQEQRAAEKELAEMGVPCYSETSVPVGFARYSEGFDHAGIQETYATRLAISIQFMVATAVAQLLIAHEACGAVQGAAVVGHRFARFFVLDSAHVATDMTLGTADSPLVPTGPVLSRKGRRLSHFLRHAHPGNLALSIAAYQPELGVSWDACIGEKFGISPPDIDFGRDVEALGRLYRETARRVSLASDSESPQRRLDTLVQDVIGRHMEPPTVQALRQPNEDVNPWGSIAIIRAVNSTASMVPVTPEEMDKLLGASSWVPAAIYMSLDRLLSVEVSDSRDTTPPSTSKANHRQLPDNQPSAPEVSEPASKSPADAETQVTKDDAEAATPSPPLPESEQPPASIAAEENIIPPTSPSESTPSLKLPSLRVASSASTDLSDFWSEDLLTDTTEGEAVHPVSETPVAAPVTPQSTSDATSAYTGTVVEVVASEENSAAHLETQADPDSWWTTVSAGPPSPQGSTAVESTPSTEAPTSSESNLSVASTPIPETTTSAVATPAAETHAPAETATPDESTTSTETTTSEDNIDAPAPPMAAPTLPPHLARLQALYDLEGDVVRTTEVTSKVDEPTSGSEGSAPQRRGTFGLRGSAGAGR